jgi:hypothetical protein
MRCEQKISGGERSVDFAWRDGTRFAEGLASILGLHLIK